MAWVAGEQLQGGKYTIERELGRGRFGITYLVKNRNSDRLVIKTFEKLTVTIDKSAITLTSYRCVRTLKLFKSGKLKQRVSIMNASCGVSFKTHLS